MAARKGTSDEDDVLVDDLDEEAVGDDFDDEDDALVDDDAFDEDDLEEDDDLEEAEVLDDEPEDLTVPVPSEDGDEDEEETAALPATVAFDDDDAEIVAAVAGDDDEDDDDEIEGVREGEFVCRSCYMAKRETQLADPERMLCRDCA
ncbi:MAG TPA: hypothetical protein VK906_13850 [Egicoccus sp.]|nr:hypothetical protein [Egicoccus sp.]HSK24264.1 hypothetical protein [Egicoccus sp.]